MTNQTDKTFITNENEATLLNRFQTLIKDTKFFDVLVGYFYTSGFHALYKSLEKTEKIRILIGIGTDKKTAVAVMDANARQQQTKIEFSHAEAQNKFAEQLVVEMENAADEKEIEQGARKFLEWLQSGKLELKAYPTANLHAKVYIMSFAEDDRDKGRVITGSSNFTQAGLVDNLEFNVELKTAADHTFAKEKFDELWADAVDIKERYIETIKQRTWLNDDITPYQLYLKFLYEYFEDELSQKEEINLEKIPEGFMRLEYQDQAVLNAKKIMLEYGGVFISDVVGLGKTYISAMLAKQLDGKTLVLAPPALLDENHPGSWSTVISDFNVYADCKSLGKLEQILEMDLAKYKNVFIDEAHRFRTEGNQTYETLAKICRGKRVALVTATPLNNTPQDILSQIKLFQNATRSTIPGVQNLQGFFARLDNNLKGLDRQNDRTEYLAVTKENARAIRQSILKYLMVRRTRAEIENYFSDDLKTQGLNFPTVKDPVRAYYQFNKKESKTFGETVQLIAKKIRYARYTPMLYFAGEIPPDMPGKQSQANLQRFMKILLIKRLESSFHAFRKTIDRFIKTHEIFLANLEKGDVYISTGNAAKLFELLESDNDDAIQKYVDDKKANKYSSEGFKDNLLAHVKNDLAVLHLIKKSWKGITRDPKLLSFIDLLKNEAVLQENKIIVFTESKETAEYLVENLEKEFPGEPLVFNGSSGAAVRKKVLDNFDARAHKPKMIIGFW